MKCTKKRYQTEEEAKQGLANVRGNAFKDNSDKIPLRYYLCSECFGYHLTSQQDKRSAQLAALYAKIESQKDEILRLKNEIRELKKDLRSINKFGLDGKSLPKNKPNNYG